MAVAAVFAACSKDDEKKGDNLESSFDGKTITANVVNGSRYNSSVSTVRAMAYDQTSYYGRESIASGSYANGGFTLTLPVTPAAKYLVLVVERFEQDFLTISNRDARVLPSLEFRAFDRNGEEVDDLVYAKEDNTSYTEVEFMYADRAVTITGSTTHYTANLSLKQGWNMVYYIESESGFVATTNPASGLKWYFGEDL